MKEIALDSPLKKLSSDALTGGAESPLASFFVCFYGESLGGCGLATVFFIYDHVTSTVGYG